MKFKYRIIGVILTFILIIGEWRYFEKPHNWAWDILEIKYSKQVSSKIKIAILDSGIRNNFINNKYVVRKYDAIKNRDNIITNSNHGSQVASIIGFNIFDKRLIGLNSRVSIYDGKVLDDNLNANINDVIDGIEWSIDNNVDIINMSFSISKYNKKLHNTIKKAHNKGIVIVAAAGNNFDIYSDYPARFPEVISVSAIDKNCKPFKYAPIKKIDYYAPGVGVYVLDGENNLNKVNGTSFSSAYFSSYLISKKISKNNLYDILCDYPIKSKGENE